MGSSLYTPRVTGYMNCALWDSKGHHLHYPLDVGATTEENQVPPSNASILFLISNSWFSVWSLGYHPQHILSILVNKQIKSLIQPSVDREAGCLSLGGVFPSPPSEDGVVGVGETHLQVKRARGCPV